MTPAELKARRAKLCWSQKQLAEELGVTVTTVARWEQNVCKISPLAEKLIKQLERK